MNKNRICLVLVIALAMTTPTSQQVSPGSWNNGLISKYQTIFQQDTVSFDASDVFTSELPVQEFNSLESKGGYTHVDIVAPWDSEIAPGVVYAKDGCQMKKHVYANMRNHYFILCNQNKLVPVVIAEGTNMPTPLDPIDLSQNLLTKDANCQDLSMSWDGKAVFVVCNLRKANQTDKWDILQYNVARSGQTTFGAAGTFDSLFEDDITIFQTSVYGDNIDTGYSVLLTTPLSPTYNITQWKGNR